jgi:hypothetical protein
MFLWLRSQQNKNFLQHAHAAIRALLFGTIGHGNICRGTGSTGHVRETAKTMRYFDEIVTKFHRF